MANIDSGSSSILILALVTIILSIYSAVSMRWWVAKKDKLTNDVVKFVLFLVAIAALIVAPMFILAYFMGRMKPETLGQYGGGIVLLVWIFPSGIYTLIHIFYRNRPK